MYQSIPKSIESKSILRIEQEKKNSSGNRVKKKIGRMESNNLYRMDTLGHISANLNSEVILNFIYFFIILYLNSIYLYIYY